VDALGNLRFRLADGVLTLAGVIDETVRLVELAARIGPEVAIDLGEVKRVNSVGVLGWLRFMRALAGRRVALRRCPPAVIEQMAMVLGFQGHARVESVLAPYACPKCHQERLELIGRKDGASGQPPARPCPSCGTAMGLDDVEPARFLGPLSPA
jgi:hypothetical protein